MKPKQLNPLLQCLSFTEATKLMLGKDSEVSPSDRLHIALNKTGTKFVVRAYSVISYQGLETNQDGTPKRTVRDTSASIDAVLFLESTPGGRKLKASKKSKPGTYFLLQPSDYTVLRILNTWAPEQLSFTDQLTQVTFYTVYARFVEGEENAKRLHAWRTDGSLPAQAKDILEKEGTTLADYQKLAVVNSSEICGYLLAMQQGTGKTPVSVVRIATEAKRITDAKPEAFYKAVIVAPLNVKFNWQGEFDKFSAVPLKCVAVDGTILQRTIQLRQIYTPEEGYKGGVAVMSYKNAADIVPLFKVLEVELDMVVLDEAHAIKSHTTKTSKAMLELRDLSKKRLALTGTPIGNSITEFWPLLEFLYPGCSGFTDFASWRRFVNEGIKLKENQQTAEQLLAAMMNLPLVKERLTRCAFFITKKEALPSLPEKLFSTLETSLTGKQRSAYTKLASEMALQIEADLERAENSDGRSRSVIIQNALNRTLKLTEITSGFIKWDEVINPVSGEVIAPAWVEYFDENPKLELLMEQLKALEPTEKAIVWSWQVPALKMIHEACNKAGIESAIFYGETKRDDRLSATARFNDLRLLDNPTLNVVNDKTTLRVMIANQAAANAGLNWLGYPPGRPELSPMNATKVFYFAKDFSHIKLDQSSDRSHRVGTREPVSVVSLLCSGTADTAIHKRLEAKGKLALEVANVRQILSEMMLED